MKMLPHCHPVEAQLLAFTTEDHTSKVLRVIPEKITIKKIYIQGLLFLTTTTTTHQ